MFATIADVRESLATPDATANSAAALADPVLQRHLSHAEGIVATYLARYAVPVSAEGVAPYPVRGWTADIAAYYAYLSFARGKNVPEDEPNRLRYNEAMEFLKQVLAGKMPLPYTVSDTDPGGDISVFNLYPYPILAGPHPHAFFPAMSGAGMTDDNLVTLTEAEYAALTTIDPDTWYAII